MNVVITTVDANHIKVEFNDYYPTYYPVSTAFYNRSEILKVEVFANSVYVLMKNGEHWNLNSVGADGIFQIDDIDGTTTWASLTVLAAQIAALIQL
jgi:hypothetical protein